jgi:AraC-like DNA-binding protein
MTSSNEKYILINSLNMIANYLVPHRLSMDEFCEFCDIKEEYFDLEFHLVPTSTLIKALTLVEEYISADKVVCALQEYISISSLGILGYIYFSCPTLDEVFTYHNLYGYRTTHVHFDVDQGKTIKITPKADACYEHYANVIEKLSLSLIRDIYQELTNSKAANALPKDFSQVTHISIPAADYFQISSTHNRNTYITLVNYYKNFIDCKLEHGSLSHKCKILICNYLNRQHKPNLDTIASDLCVSTRTLRRKLLSEGVSFQKLLDHTLYDFINHLLYLGHDLDKIHSLVGYTSTTGLLNLIKRVQDTD